MEKETIKVLKLILKDIKKQPYKTPDGKDVSDSRIMLPIEMLHHVATKIEIDDILVKAKTINKDKNGFIEQIKNNKIWYKTELLFKHSDMNCIRYQDVPIRELNNFTIDNENGFWMQDKYASLLGSEVFTNDEKTLVCDIEKRVVAATVAIK